MMITITHAIGDYTIAWNCNVYKDKYQAEISLDVAPGNISVTEYLIRSNQANYSHTNKSFETKYGVDIDIFSLKDLKSIKESLHKLLETLDKIGITIVHFNPVDYRRYLATMYILRGRRNFKTIRDDGYNPRSYIKYRDFVGFITLIK